MIKRIKALFSIILLAGSFAGVFGVKAESPVYVFDLGGVLFDTSTVTISQQLGITNLLWYAMRNRSTKVLKTRFYETLDHMSHSKENPNNPKDPDGTPIPQIMIDWIRGTYSNKVILKRVIREIKQHPDWFYNHQEQLLVARLARTIFDPAFFVKSRKLLPDLLPFIILLKKHGAKLYVLSNWDKESFALLKDKYRDLFDLFDGYICSGESNHVKPESEIYAEITKLAGTNNVCFLDDQMENLKAAQEVGWHTIHVTKKSTLFGSKIDIDPIWQQGLEFLKQHNAHTILSLQENILQKLEPNAV